MMSRKVPAVPLLTSTTPAALRARPVSAVVEVVKAPLAVALQSSFMSDARVIPVLLKCPRMEALVTNGIRAVAFILPKPDQPEELAQGVVAPAQSSRTMAPTSNL